MTRDIRIVLFLKWNWWQHDAPKTLTVKEALEAPLILGQP